jgi:ABC-type branched-subunit amino acid transport system substrate-binding protein
MMKAKHIAVALTLCIIVAGCSSVNGSNGNSKGSLVFGMLMPFSGPSAPDGGQVLNGCLTAAVAINSAGGILGHQVVCQANDTRSDPVDTVPAAQKMLATTSNLVGVLGPDSGVAAAVTPMLEKAHMVMFSVAGDPFYDHNPSPYFYRLTPSDDLAAAALALYAKDRGFKRIALVFTTDGSAQTNDPPLVVAAKYLGLQIVSNLQFPADQSSYQTEVASLISSNPQVILSETDPQSAGTFFSELNEAGGVRPMIITAESLFAEWQTAVKTAIGESDMAKYVTTVAPYAPATGKAWQLYAGYIRKAKGTNPAQYTSDIYARTEYDGTILMALAMLMANSTSPARYNQYITQIAAPATGKTLVYSYAEGKAALAAEKKIQYIGAGGAITLNVYHSVTGVFEIEKWAGPSGFALEGSLSASALAQISKD